MNIGHDGKRYSENALIYKMDTCIKAKDIQTLTAVDKCLLGVLNMNVQFWEIYEMIGESKMLYWIEIQAVKRGQKYTDEIQGG